MTEVKNLLTGANPYAGAKIAIIGDVMVDQFVYGEVSRISPEAPVPVVHVQRKEFILGGTSNAANNLSALGAKPLLIGRIGKDNNAQIFKEKCEAAGIASNCLIEGDLPTIFKTRVVARTQQVVRVDEEEIAPLSKQEHADVLNMLKKVRQEADVIVVSDYGKGMLSQELLNEIIALWKDGTIIIDPKPSSGIDYTGVTSMTPNLKEAAELTGLKKLENTDAAVEKCAHALMEKYGLEYLMLTRSEKGVSLCFKDGHVEHLPTHAREIIDVVGAGDTMISSFAAGIANGLTVSDAARLSNVAAGVVVDKVGTATATWQDMQNH